MRLEQWNALAADQAEAELRKCCGSSNWSRRMTAARPFDGISALLAEAERVWWSLTPDDWLEAFRAHPKIGEKKAASAQSQEAQQWSAQEQAGTELAAAQTKAALAAGNQKYQERFGFIFIICAAGKSAEEMLAALNARLHNEIETEIRIAAEEQRKITRLRLQKLIDQ